MEINVQIAVIGGGPAGLAAAVSASENGIPASDILILERSDELGGILNQCIHNGFGLHTFQEELTGPEYAARFIDKVQDRKIPYRLNTMVIGLAKNSDDSLMVRAMNETEGLIFIHAKALVLAMGCRERPRGALNIPGQRPAGIYTAGTAQRFVNLEGRMPGREIVILGSGDIGLIMARRMTLEGARVQAVAEVMSYSGGLRRNIVQCLDDFGIPLLLSHTVVDIQGKKRVEGVMIAEVDESRQVIPGTQKEYACDTLLLSCGLIPENELTTDLGVKMSRVTNGAVVNESLETSIPGVFACGNVLHVHDLVDFVSEEAGSAGKNAALYCQDQGGNVSSLEGAVRIQTEDGIRYSVPSYIRPDHMEERTKIRFRVSGVYKNVRLEISLDDKVLREIPKRVMAPGEMEEVHISGKDLAGAGKNSVLFLRIKEGAA